MNSEWNQEVIRVDVVYEGMGGMKEIVQMDRKFL